MAWHGFLVKVAPHLVTFAAYEALHKVVAKAPWREATVTAMACGVRGARKVGERAEQARLTAADMFAEAIERAGRKFHRQRWRKKVHPSRGNWEDQDH